MEIYIPTDHSFGDDTVEYFEEQGIEVGVEFEVPSMDFLEDLFANSPEPVMFGTGVTNGAHIMLHPHDI